MRIRLLAAVVLVLAASPAAAAIVQVEIPATEGTHAFDLGITPDQINSVTLAFAGVAADFHYLCHNEYPGGSTDYEFDDGYHVFFALSSGGDLADYDWFSPNGTFDMAIELQPYGYSDQFLADGAGTLLIDWWIELFPPQSDDCAIDTPGSISFAGPILLIVDYDGPVAQGDVKWGSLKSTYR